MNETEIMSIPSGVIGALCQQGVEENGRHIADEDWSTQQEEVLSLLRQLWTEGHLSLSGYWLLTDILGS